MVGNGINKLFERALPEGEKTEENVLRVRKEFLAHYDVHNADDSSPYPGTSALLLQLQAAGIQLAVASNKYQSATEKLVAHYFPESASQPCWTTRRHQRETRPTIVHDILKAAQVEKEDVLYVGDSGVDMQTAANAGVTACGVTWGIPTTDRTGSRTPCLYRRHSRGNRPTGFIKTSPATGNT